MSASHRSILAAAALGAALLLASVATAQVPTAVPSAANSSIPACVVASPDGAFVATVVVRDLANNPVQGSRVVLDLSGCGVFVPCTFVCAGCTAFPAAHTVQKFTDINGVANFDLRAGGTCYNERVTISADAVFLGTAAYSALDQDGDLSVTGADVVRVQAAQSSGNLSADFDCSGTVTGADMLIVQTHLGTTCNGVVPAVRPTWGRIKGAYR